MQKPQRVSCKLNYGAKRGRQAGSGRPSKEEKRSSHPRKRTARGGRPIEKPNEDFETEEDRGAAAHSGGRSYWPRAVFVPACGGGAGPRGGGRGFARNIRGFAGVVWGGRRTLRGDHRALLSRWLGESAKFAKCVQGLSGSGRRGGRAGRRRGSGRRGGACRAARSRRWARGPGTPSRRRSGRSRGGV